MTPRVISRGMAGAILPFLLCGQPVRAAVVQVYVLAGQSQAVNYDNNAANIADPALRAAQTNVDFWYRSGFWPDNSSSGVISSGNKWVDLAPQPKGGTQVYSSRVPSGGSGFGPELTLGRDLAAGLPGQNVAIIKYAWNSTSLGTRTDREGWNPADRNQIYDGLVAEVNSALAALVAAGHTPVVNGFFWIQGEGDQQQTPQLYHLYQQNLTNLVTAVRAQWNPDMAVVISPLSTAQITPEWTAYYQPGFDAVRAAQIAVGEAGPLNRWIETDDLAVVSGTVHFNEASTQIIGSRMAEAYLAIVPEPSAFAVVAGLVVLGLVAGRRRLRR